MDGDERCVCQRQKKNINRLKICNHHRWVHLAFHHSSPLLLPKVIREQSGGCDIE